MNQTSNSITQPALTMPSEPLEMNQRVYNAFGDLLLNADAVAHVLKGTANRFVYQETEWRVAQMHETLATLLHVFGSLLPALNWDEVNQMGLDVDCEDMQKGYCALMQMASGLTVALAKIQAACVQGLCAYEPFRKMNHQE